MMEDKMLDDSDKESAPIAATKKPGKRGRPPKTKIKTNQAEDHMATPLPVASGRKREPKERCIREKEPEEDLTEEEFDDKDLEESPTKTNQGPIEKPADDFTTGEFVVRKTDVIASVEDPPIYKIYGNSMLQKYLPFIKDDKIFYKNTLTFNVWSPYVKDQYYSAPVEFIEHTSKQHIVEFYKDKVDKDLEFEETASN